MNKDLSDQFPSAEQLHEAIDIVGRLAEQASRVSDRGPSEHLLAETFAGAFRYMVALSHHLAVYPGQPNQALVEAAAGLPELGPSELNYLRAHSRAFFGSR